MCATLVATVCALLWRRRILQRPLVEQNRSAPHANNFATHLFARDVHCWRGAIAESVPSAREGSLFLQVALLGRGRGRGAGRGTGRGRGRGRNGAAKAEKVRAIALSKADEGVEAKKRRTGKGYLLTLPR